MMSIERQKARPAVSLSAAAILISGLVSGCVAAVPVRSIGG